MSEVVVTEDQTNILNTVLQILLAKQHYSKLPVVEEYEAGPNNSDSLALVESFLGKLPAEDENVAEKKQKSMENLLSSLLSDKPPNEIPKPRDPRAERNEKERIRVRELDKAMDKLKEHIPFQPKNMARVDVLRMAINYIHLLQEMVRTNEQPSPWQCAGRMAKGLSRQATWLLANSLEFPVPSLSNNVHQSLHSLDPQNPLPPKSSSTSPRYSHSSTPANQ
ncbi:hypothetical protein GCK72_007647 [Caenorhabditis remanei]|uniref:BHLH domain-containing protein n=1 Tax=Caenorhabditis remanei TaxID=31234 RepID=A0A6A5HIJ0_CAERE|nr:hypothetical protein GCK72_007647 [Caenorhabditis remanei]KAF1767688.1 hypothetical protein GCK72_007647 [Caenorhabditis remanei]